MIRGWNGIMELWYYGIMEVVMEYTNLSTTMICATEKGCAFYGS